MALGLGVISVLIIEFPATNRFQEAWKRAASQIERLFRVNEVRKKLRLIYIVLIADFFLT